jgi:hypothetical protein
MQKTVMRLEEDSVRGHRRMTHVRRKVSHHETVFQDTLNQTQRALQQHADMLVKQQHVAQVCVHAFHACIYGVKMVQLICFRFGVLCTK